jgi:hypothetical protein
MRALLFGMAAATVCLAATLSFAAGSSSASATTITFDGLTAGPIGTTYVEKGYQFFNPDGDLFTWGVGGANSFDQSAGSTTLAQPFDFTTTTMSRIGGGAFNFASADFADALNTDNNFTYQFVFNFVGGSSVTQIIMLDGDFGSQTLQFNYANLLSVSWGNDPGNDPFGLQWDNVKVSAVAQTPIPAALPLFISALGALLFFGWRRQNESTSPDITA